MNNLLSKLFSRWEKDESFDHGNSRLTGTNFEHSHYMGVIRCCRGSQADTPFAWDDNLSQNRSSANGIWVDGRSYRKVFL